MSPVGRGTVANLVTLLVAAPVFFYAAGVAISGDPAGDLPVMLLKLTAAAGAVFAAVNTPVLLLTAASERRKAGTVPRGEAELAIVGAAVVADAALLGLAAILSPKFGGPSEGFCFLAVLLVPAAAGAQRFARIVTADFPPPPA